MRTEKSVLDQHIKQVAEAVREATELTRYDLNQAHGPKYLRLKRWVRLTQIGCGSLVIGCAFVGAILGSGPSSDSNQMLLVWALLFGAVAFVAAPLLELILDTAYTFVLVRSPGAYYQAEAESHLESARSLARFASPVLADVDTQMEQRLKRYESRQVHLFSNDQLRTAAALGTLGVAAWQKWDTILTVVPVASIQFVLAFGGGALLGGLVVRIQVVRLQHQRDMVKLAQSLRELLDQEIPGDAPSDSAPLQQAKASDQPHGTITGAQTAFGNH